MAAASFLPATLARGMAETAGVAASRGAQLAGPWAGVGPLTGMGDRRRMVASHLRRVYGAEIDGWRLSRMVDEVFASYARYWAESLRLPGLGSDRIRAGISYDGYERIQAGIDAGRGTILALPHLGGWEWAGAHLALSGLPMSVVVERVEPPDLFEWFVSFREQLGMHVIPVGPRAGSECAKVLARNGVLCLLCDRMVGDASSVEVEFFGEHTQLPAGPATLALRTGATLLPAAVYLSRRSEEHNAVVREPILLSRTGKLRIDVQAGTQRLAQELEYLIRRAPTQWHLMQPNWPSDAQPQVRGSNGRPTREE